MENPWVLKNHPLIKPQTHLSNHVVQSNHLFSLRSVIIAISSNHTACYSETAGVVLFIRAACKHAAVLVQNGK